MSEEEKKAINWFDTERKLVEITKGDNNYFSIILNLIDKLQKDNYKLDRENQHLFDRIQDLQKENKELKKNSISKDLIREKRNDLINEYFTKFVDNKHIYLAIDIIDEILKDSEVN